MSMNAKAMMAGSVILAAAVMAGEDEYKMTLNPKAVPPGSVVRIAAVRPAINLGRATVVECTSNQVTLRHNHDRFTVAATNILDMIVIEKGVVTASDDESAKPGSEGGKESAAPAASLVKNLWARLRSLWQPAAPAKATPQVNPTR